MYRGNDDPQDSTPVNEYRSGSFTPLVTIFSALLAVSAQQPERRLDPKAMAFLPAFVFKEWGDRNQEDPTECAVCLSMLEQEDTARLLPNCNHIFHAECIQKWIISSQSTCPICRA
ncbi:hypothetical protein Ancab_023682 [Ancistrocladus abbreviatus]